VSDATSRLSAALADRYVIERELGQGGMATVYLAEDLKHKRKVALKVLRPELAAVLGAERFVQEITTTASLQHPHILPLYDSGSTVARDGGSTEFLYYVMPYIQGETLREKLDRDTQLGIDEAVGIATEVADALDYAHRHGVIHRDIKPENILLHDGRAMVADFGIALAVSAAAGGRMTETGMSLGTPHYMSPEQATAEKDLTPRSDVYSLGSVLFEMLTGEPPHTGASAQAIIMKIVTDIARPVTDLRRSVPPNVAAAVARALEKLPADRFESASAFAAALGNSAFTVAGTAAQTRTGPRDAGRVPRRLLAGVSGLSVVFLGAALWGWLRAPDVPDQPVVRFTLELPVGAAPATSAVASTVAISPDGSTIVYAGEGDPETQLYRRAIDRVEVEAIPNTAGGDTPFFSPDGRWVGFRQGNRLRKVDLASGSVFTVATLEQSTLVVGAAWSRADTIYFALEAVSGLMHVPSDGGPVTRVGGADTSALYWQQTLLPDDRWILSTVSRASDSGEVYSVEALSLETGERRLVADNTTWATYLPTGQLLLLTAEGALATAAFDGHDPQPAGSRVPIAGTVLRTGSGQPLLAVSHTGTFVYLSGGAPDNVLVTVDRAGRETPLLETPRSYSNPRLSPDGHRLSYIAAISNEGQVWTTDLETGTTTRHTFVSDNLYPIWTPDGRHLVFTSRRLGIAGLWSVPVDGSAPAEQLMTGTGLRFPGSITPDGATLFYRETAPGTGMDLHALALNGEREPQTILASRFNENSPTISPDGRWLAYASDQYGRYEIFVRGWPEGSAQWQISDGGGTEPVWNPRGGELFYRSGTRLMAARVAAADDRLRVVQRDSLFSGSYLANVRWPEYDVYPDGNRFVFVRLGQSDVRPVVVVNWLEELARRTGPE